MKTSLELPDIRNHNYIRKLTLDNASLFGTYWNKIKAKIKAICSYEKNDIVLNT